MVRSSSSEASIRPSPSGPTEASRAGSAKQLESPSTPCVASTRTSASWAFWPFRKAVSVNSAPVEAWLPDPKAEAAERASSPVEGRARSRVRAPWRRQRSERPWSAAMRLAARAGLGLKSPKAATVVLPGVLWARRVRRKAAGPSAVSMA